VENPERARWTRLARLGSQAGYKIRFILPAGGFSHSYNNTVIKRKVRDFMFKFSFVKGLNPGVIS